MSNDKAEEIKRNILSPSQWVRILFMAVYAVAWWILTFVIAAIVVLQTLICLVTGRDNENLREVGQKLADYFHEILLFLVYETDRKPWPFENDDDSGDNGSHEDAADNDSEFDVAATGAGDEGGSEQGSGGDDVFADISFTEAGDTESAAEEDEDEGEQEPDDGLEMVEPQESSDASDKSDDSEEEPEDKNQ